MLGSRKKKNLQQIQEQQLMQMQGQQPMQMQSQQPMQMQSQQPIQMQGQQPMQMQGQQSMQVQEQQSMQVQEQQPMQMQEQQPMQMQEQQPMQMQGQQPMQMQDQQPMQVQQPIQTQQGKQSKLTKQKTVKKRDEKEKRKLPYKSRTRKNNIFGAIMAFFMILTVLSFINTNTLNKKIKDLQQNQNKAEVQKMNFRPDTDSFGKEFINVYYFYTDKENNEKRSERLKKYTTLTFDIDQVDGKVKSVNVVSSSLKQVIPVDDTTDELFYNVTRNIVGEDDSKVKTIQNNIAIKVSNKNGLMAVVSTPRYVSNVNLDSKAENKDPNNNLPGETIRGAEYDTVKSFIETYMKAYTADNAKEENYKLLKTLQVENLTDPGFAATIDKIEIEKITKENDTYYAVIRVKVKEDVQRNMKYTVQITKNGKNLLVKNKL